MIEEFTAEMDFEAFRSNPMAVAAVERKLLTIGEAADSAWTRGALDRS
jgi:uncharacterized protein with HEPN domain